MYRKGFLFFSQLTLVGILFFSVFAVPTLACYAYPAKLNPGDPDPIVWNTGFEVNVVTSYPNSSYVVYSCTSDSFLAAGLACTASNAIRSGSILAMFFPNLNGRLLQMDAAGKGVWRFSTGIRKYKIPVLGTIIDFIRDPSLFIAFTLHDSSDNIVDSCSLKMKPVDNNPGNVDTADTLKQICDYGTGANKGVDTAIGCVPTDDLTPFLSFILKWVFFASGGLILLMSISTGYTLLTSGGNPEKLQAAKENIVSLLSGLALIVFSMVLLQAIGADILGLPGFGP